jgi:glucose-1-phosphate thymidylyltransferase
MHAFILAGGFATRLWPLTEKRAKPLLPLAGKPILTHLLEKIPEDMPVTVSTNAAFAEGFQEWAEKNGRDNLTILIEETKSDSEKLGALGAVAEWITKENVQDDVLLLTGDNYLGFSMEKFLESATPSVSLIAAHDIGDTESAKAFGTVIVDESRKNVMAFEEKPSNPKSTLISTGCSILPASVLPILTTFAKKHPDNVGGIFEELLRQNMPIECFTFSDPWFDIGSFDAYLEATKVLVGNLVLSEESATHENTDTEGSIVIGKGSSVNRSTLTDTVIFEDCIVEDCVLHSCILDHHCVLRGIDLTGKMLREGTNLEQKA